MRIAAALPEDLRDVAAVHVASWQSAYQGILPAGYLATLSVERREATWRQILAEGRSELFVARHGAGVVGFVSFGPCRDEAAPSDRGEVWAIYVAPGAWSAGVGQALWRVASERLGTLGFRSVSLWVIEGNERARRFYSAAGFSVEAGSEKEFELGGTTLREVRMVVKMTADRVPMNLPRMVTDAERGVPVGNAFAAALNNVQHETRALGLVALVVRDYDEALAFYLDVLGFDLVEDTPIPAQGKRWVVITPGKAGARLLLAKASSQDQLDRVGSQSGGRVFLFLYTDDCMRDYLRFSAQGVRFIREPESQAHGLVAVFVDLYGNPWDLIQPNADNRSWTW